MERIRSESLDMQPVDGPAGVRLLELTAEEIRSRQESDEFKDLVAFVRRLHSECRNARIPEERQWYKNIDMVQGRQFTVWDIRKSQMVEARRLPEDVRIAVNIIEPIVRTELAKTGSNAPTAVVAPASNDIDDIMAAQAGEQAYEWWHEESDFQTKTFNPANWWRAVCGNGFIKVFYDAGRVDAAAAAAAQQLAEQQARERAQLEQANVSFIRGAEPTPPPTPVAEPVRGVIRAEHVTPFHIFVPDPAILDLQEQPYMVHVYTRKIEQARLAYGDRLPPDWNPSPIGANTVVDLNRLGIRGYPAISPDSVLITELWMKPGYDRRFPNGGLVIVCGDDVVHLAKDGIPYQHGEYPFAMLTGIENGKFYRKSVVQSLTPLQNELNHTVSQIVKKKNLTTNPGHFYDEGSIDPRRVPNVPGQWIPVRLGMRYPSPIPIADLPSFIPNFLQQVKGWLDDISGQHQVSRAISPGADTAASALALLQETDDNFLFTTFDSIESAMKSVGRQVLSLMVQFWNEPRLVKVVGREAGFDAKLLKGADLKNGTDLRMEAGSGLPTSKAGKIATVTEWMDKGFVDPIDGLEAIEMGTLGRVWNRIKLDKMQAQRENIEIRDLDVEEVRLQLEQYNQQLTMYQKGMQSGLIPPTQQPPGHPSIYPIGWQDNDEVHIAEHKAFAKGQLYAALDPAIQKVLEWHVADHEARATQKLMQQMALTGAAPTPEQGEATASGAEDPGYDAGQASAEGAA